MWRVVAALGSHALTRLYTPNGAVARLVLVPSFATTGTIVLVNLRTLAPHSITFFNCAAP